MTGEVDFRRADGMLAASWYRHCEAAPGRASARPSGNSSPHSAHRTSETTSSGRMSTSVAQRGQRTGMAGCSSRLPSSEYTTRFAYSLGASAPCCGLHSASSVQCWLSCRLRGLRAVGPELIRSTEVSVRWPRSAAQRRSKAEVRRGRRRRGAPLPPSKRGRTATARRDACGRPRCHRRRRPAVR